MKSLYCTETVIGETGGGACVKNELMALQSISDGVFILTGKELSLEKLHQPENPFLRDYFALQSIQGKHFDLAHFYGGCFSETIRYLKEHGTKISCMVAAHDREISIEEFHRLGLEYPFHHVSDDYLWNIYTKGYRLADLVLSQSTKSAEILKSMGCKNIKVVPGGMDWPEEVKPIPANFDVCYVGAIGPDKSLLDLIQAWGMLNYSDSRLILAGGGTETLEPFIRQITDKGNFVLLGRVANVADVYNACSVYVQSSATEGFSLEIPEVMSFARPVIVTEGVGAKDCVEAGITGFVVAIRDPAAIAAKIDWFRNNRQQMLKMGEQARDNAKNYSWDKIRQRYIQVWTQMFRTGKL